MVKRQINSKENIKLQTGFVKWMLYYIAVFLIMWIVLWLSIYPPVADSFVADADTALKLLEGYKKQHLFIGVVIVSVVVVLIGFAAIALVLQIKSWRKPKYKTIVTQWTRQRTAFPEGVIIVFAAFAIFPVLILRDEHIFDRYKLFAQDVIAIEENRLETAIVQFETAFESTGLEALGGQYKNTVVWYKGTGYKVDNNAITEEPVEARTNFYVPLFLEFTADTEKATRYRITYTPNLHLVTLIEVE